ncbi:hypothetical protein KP509_02G048200 [Ceratopteris richardii]|nr:hypothetical protein KP509_02G048200 [Ceratopteris richardii]
MKSSPRKRKASRKIASSGKVQHHNSSKVSKVNSTCIKSSDLCYKCKNADVKDKSNQGRNGSRQKNVKNVDRIEPPKVTILQRPESDEAAVKLFTEFFQTDTHETSKQSDRAFKSKIFGSSDLETDFGDHWHLDRSLDLNTSSLNASKTVRSSPFTNLPSPRNVIRGRDNPKATQDNKAFPSRSTQILVSTKLEMHADDGLVHDMKGFKYKSSCEEVDEERERWAGPSFVNSPPPCALPFPQFSKKHPEAVTSDNSHTQTLKGGAISDDLFKSDDLFSMSPMFTRHSYLNVSLDAMTSATNELKRLLNVGI